MGLYIYCFWCEFEQDFLKASIGSLPNTVFPVIQEPDGRFLYNSYHLLGSLVKPMKVFLSPFPQTSFEISSLLSCPALGVDSELVLDVQVTSKHV